MRYFAMFIIFAVVLATSMHVQESAEEGTPSTGEREEVTVPNGVGDALMWVGGPRSVLLLHGAAYDAESWTDQAEALNDAGYTVLALESIEPEAIRSAIEWLVDSAGASAVVVIGASAGGGSALSALAEPLEGVVGLVLLGATGDPAGLGTYPKLFTASEGEGMTDRLEAMAEEAPGDVNLVETIPGDAHAQATFQQPEGEQLLDLILEFLESEVAWPAGLATPAGTPTD